MEFFCLLLMHVQQYVVVLLDAVHFGDRDEEIGPYIANFALHIALLIPGIGIAEADPASIVRMETLEKLGFMDFVTYPAADTGGVVEYQKSRHTADVLEDILQSLADTFSRLTAKHLHKAVVAVGKGHRQVFHAAAEPLHIKVGLPKIDLCRTRFPDQFLVGLGFLAMADGLDVALDCTVGPGEPFLETQTVIDPFRRVLLFMPGALVFFQTFLDKSFIRIQHGRLAVGNRWDRRKILLFQVFSHSLTIEPHFWAISEIRYPLLLISLIQLIVGILSIFLSSFIVGETK